MPFKLHLDVCVVFFVLVIIFDAKVVAGVVVIQVSFVYISPVYDVKDGNARHAVAILCDFKEVAALLGRKVIHAVQELGSAFLGIIAVHVAVTEPKVGITIAFEVPPVPDGAEYRIYAKKDLLDDVAVAVELVIERQVNNRIV